MDNIKNYKAYPFLSWNDGGEIATALCEPYGTTDSGSLYWWFDAAINCMRDGDMGEKGPDGVYDRIWMGDSISEEDEHPRPATEEEVNKWLVHCLKELKSDSEFFPSILDKYKNLIGVIYLPTGPVALFHCDSINV